MTSREAEVGRAVRTARTRAGLQQSELAQRMRAAGWRWRQETVSEVENGRQPLRLLEAVDVAATLNVELGDLLADPLTRLLATVESQATPRRAAVRTQAADAAHALRVLDEVRRGRPQHVTHDFPDRLASALLHADSSDTSDIAIALGVRPRAARDLAERHQVARSSRDARAADEFRDAVWSVMSAVQPGLASATTRLGPDGQDGGQDA